MADKISPGPSRRAASSKEPGEKGFYDKKKIGIQVDAGQAALFEVYRADASACAGQPSCASPLVLKNPLSDAVLCFKVARSENAANFDSDANSNTERTTISVGH